MTNVYDFKLDEDGDLAIENGDFVIHESSNQHIRDILASAAGYFKSAPKLGWNPYSRLNSRVEKQRHIQDAIIQLQSDGWRVNAIDFTTNDGALQITKLDVVRP